MVLYDPKNGEFTIANTGGADIEVLDITTTAAGAIFTPAFPVTVPVGTGLTFTVTTEPAGDDLEGEGITVETDCGINGFIY